MSTTPQTPDMERQSIDVDIVCVGFGPAVGGFLTTLSRAVTNEDGSPALCSKIMPGMPLQISCYERADDIGFGVSGVATRARGIRETIPDLDVSQISMAAEISSEKIVYLLDPVGASRRSRPLRLVDSCLRMLKWLPNFKHDAVELPYIPPFLRKEGGYVLSIGQFTQWVGSQVMGAGTAAIWPGTPVKGPLIENESVVGVRLLDQGVEKDGSPGPGFMPGMDIRAALTVVGDGPVGAVGRQLDEHFGMPEGHHQTDWAVGTKMVIDLPDGIDLEPGAIIHTLGFPEPEIFGFFYVHNRNLVSVGIFVPSWFYNPARTSYRYLQHWMQHPYIWRYLKNGKLRSWGAKSLQESGKRGEPFLAGNGYARIGEGSGSTNVLTGSGVDEAWTTGVQLAESVIELLQSDQDFTKENLYRTYVKCRRTSWIENEGKVAERSRDGFTRGFLTGLMGMALAGLTGGRISIPGKIHPSYESIPPLEDFFSNRIPPRELDRIVKDCQAKGLPLHDILMDKSGWPAIAFDGKLLMSQQDALLLGGKVQAPPGYADHVVFLYPDLCNTCSERICVEICSGQAIENDPEGGVRFDREKCVHCGACMWNCSRMVDGGTRTNLQFTAGPGGLHSAEN